MVGQLGRQGGHQKHQGDDEGPGGTLLLCGAVESAGRPAIVGRRFGQRTSGDEAGRARCPGRFLDGFGMPLLRFTVNLCRGRPRTGANFCGCLQIAIGGFRIGLGMFGRYGLRD
jgi:hypothetical protein